MHISATGLKFLQGLLADSRDRAPSASAELFRRESYIGTQIGRRFVYAPEDVARAKNLLVALNLPLTANNLPTDRADAARHPGISEKSGTLDPHANAVAFRVFVGRVPVNSPATRLQHRKK